jgi:hypothetical protein
MQAGNLGLPNEPHGDAFRVTYAKKPRLIPKNLKVLEARGQAVRVLEMAEALVDKFYNIFYCYFSSIAFKRLSTSLYSCDF